MILGAVPTASTSNGKCILIGILVQFVQWCSNLVAMAHWHKIAELSTEPYQNCGYFGALRLFEPYEFISMYI